MWKSAVTSRAKPTIRKAAIWLSSHVGKPLLKLTDEDYNEHGLAGNPHTQFVPDDIVDRFCIVGPVSTHIERMVALKALGVDQFAIYLQHDDKDHTLQMYGEKVMADAAWVPVATGKNPLFHSSRTQNWVYFDFANNGDITNVWLKDGK